MRVTALLDIIGHDALDMYNNFKWGDKPKDKYSIKEVLKKFHHQNKRKILRVAIIKIESRC